MTAMEAYLRLYNYPIVEMSHSIYVLPVHGENEQHVVCDEDQTDAEMEAKLNKKTRLTGFFALCDRDDSVGQIARTYTYEEIPNYFRSFSPIFF